MLLPPLSAQCSVVCHVAATYVILCHTTIELGLELASQSYSGVMVSHAENDVDPGSIRCSDRPRIRAYHIPSL